LVDTPGYNEMSGLGVDRKIIEDVFERQIKKTDYIIYVLDYKYYKAEENIEILEKIKLYRKDIFENENIVFILNKIDLMTYKDGDISSIIEEVTALLSTVGVKNPAILPFSAKKAFFYKLLEKGNDIEKYRRELDDLNEPIEQIIEGQAYMVKLPIDNLKENFYKESNIQIFEERVLKELFRNREDLLIESLNGCKKTIIEKFLKNSKEDLEELVNNFLEEKNKALEKEEKKNKFLELTEKIKELLDRGEKMIEEKSLEEFKKRYYYQCDYVNSEYVYPYCMCDEHYSGSYSAEENGKVKFRNWKQTIKPNFLDIYNYYNSVLNGGGAFEELKAEAKEILEEADSIRIDLENFVDKSIYIETNIRIKQKQLMNLTYDNSEAFLEDGYDNSTFVDYDTEEKYVEGFFGEKLKTVYVYDITKAMREEEKDIIRAQERCSELFLKDFYKKYNEYNEALGEIVCRELEKLMNAVYKIEMTDEVEEVKSDDEENIVIMGTIFNKLEAYLGGEV
ncbi:MAG: hypothetical protein ACRC28_00860, partial [Clostridium sp.]|uniref:hypothetical protein n=1 Tax=Clostridium sp. TaxID=1506 RepID=UPI003F2C77DA